MERARVLFFLMLWACASECSLYAQDAQASVAEVVEVSKESKAHIQNIIVKGNNAKLRMAISSIATKMSDELSALLGEKSMPKAARPVTVSMYEHGDAAKNLQVRPTVSTIDGAIVISLLVDTRGTIDRSVLAHGLIDVLLYERGLRGKQVLADDEQVNVPAWLSHGLIEAMVWKKDNTRRRVYEYLLEHPDVFPLEQLMQVSGRDFRTMDTTKQEFFRAASCALVLAMLMQDGGEAGMKGVLEEVVLFEGDMSELLRKHFPSMNTGRNALKKLWSLQIAQMATPKVVETMTITETDQKLAKALFLTLYDADGEGELIPLQDLAKLTDKSQADRVLAINNLQAELVQLSYRCYPLYRPLLLEYGRVLEDLTQGKMDDLAVRLENLRNERTQMIIADERCRDYLDWYQISRATTVTGDFSGYMRLKERLATEREQRKDKVLDVYMDKMQKLIE